MKYWLMAVSSAVRTSFRRETTCSWPACWLSNREVGSQYGATIVRALDLIKQCIQHSDAAAAVRAGPAGVGEPLEGVAAALDSRPDDVVGDAPAETDDHYLYPARSASRVAAAWNSPADAVLMSSCLNFPHFATIGFTAACGFAGNSNATSANICWASAVDRNSRNLMALVRFFAWAVTPAPDTFTWVPVVCWLAQNGRTGNAGSFATIRAR